MATEFYAWNENNYAIVEAYTSSNLPVHTLKVPMHTGYETEVSYILNSEDWSDESENFYHSYEADWEEFTAGDTPKLIKWWLATLPVAKETRRATWIEPKNKMPFWNWLRSLTVLVRMNKS